MVMEFAEDAVPRRMPGGDSGMPVPIVAVKADPGCS